jgi:membrane fusion protein, multidrug efflux system
MARQWWIVGAAAMACATAGCGGRAETAAQASTAPRAVPVTVAPLKHVPVERTVDIVGTLKGHEEVTVGAKLVSTRVARVARVRHDIGDRVKPGEVLVELETVDAKLAVDQAERQFHAELAKLGLKELPAKDFDVDQVPSVAQARVALERARQNLSRQRSLTARGAGTTQELQNAENDVFSNEAALANAQVMARSTLANAQALRVALDVARRALDDLEIRAPVPSAIPKGHAGPVLYALCKRQVAEGQMLKQGDPVVQLVIEDPLRLWADVPERFSAEVRVGQPVRVATASRPGETFEGKVARINPTIDPVSRTFQVEATIPNPDGLLRPGGFAKAQIVTRRDAEAAVVPTEAVYRFAGVTQVFVVQGDKARAIPVTTDLEGRGWVEVHGDLPATAQVVTTGQTQLADGTLVVVRHPEAEAKPASPAGAGL